MKIYTRTGDDGTTGLLGKDRVPKHDARVEAYGSVDELNALLGVAQTHDGERWFVELLPALQTACFQVGAELATTDASLLARLTLVSDDDIAALEREIDRLEADLVPLTRFVLPGGTPLAAALHHARTVCRRAERRVTALSAKDAVNARVVRWLNRVADLLFVMARWANFRAGVADRTWAGRSGG
jgi:cob(I)alamin adenosyltransferase